MPHAEAFILLVLDANKRFQVSGMVGIAPETGPVPHAEAFNLLLLDAN